MFYEYMCFQEWTHIAHGFFVNCKITSEKSYIFNQSLAVRCIFAHHFTRQAVLRGAQAKAKIKSKPTSEMNAVLVYLPLENCYSARL